MICVPSGFPLLFCVHPVGDTKRTKKMRSVLAASLAHSHKFFIHWIPAHIDIKVHFLDRRSHYLMISLRFSILNTLEIRYLMNLLYWRGRSLTFYASNLTHHLMARSWTTLALLMPIGMFLGMFHDMILFLVEEDGVQEKKKKKRQQLKKKKRLWWKKFLEGKKIRKIFFSKENFFLEGKFFSRREIFTSLKLNLVKAVTKNDTLTDGTAKNPTLTPLHGGTAKNPTYTL